MTSIEGTTLDNGTGTVLITVTAENGSAFYPHFMYLWMSLARRRRVRPSPRREAPTERLPRPLHRDSATEITQNEAYIKLNNQVNSYKERLDLSMKIIYGLIAFSVLLLFIIINQILRNKDLKDDLRDMEEMGANMGGYGQETYGDNENYYEEPAKPMTRKEKKSRPRREEKQRAKKGKQLRARKKGNQNSAMEQQQDAYQGHPQTWQQGPRPGSSSRSTSRHNSSRTGLPAAEILQQAEPM